MKTLRLVLMITLLASGPAFAEKIVVRMGHFPNITHTQALVAHQLSRQGKGWFEQKLGPDVEIQWFTYNAGPSAMEAILAKSLDVTYVGPNPALNAYFKSQGEEIRILAGSAEGGAALVVQGDGRIAKPADFKGRKVATPQLGNTQDVVCRAWLMAQGFKVTQLGGDVQVIPTANPDQLSLFQKKELDAVWTVEPWVSRLELEAGGKVFIEDTNAITTILVSSVQFLKDHQELATRLTVAHAQLTQWIKANTEEAQKLAALEIKEETTRPMAPELLQKTWPRLRFTSEISVDALKQFVKSAQEVGFLKDASTDLSGIRP